MLELRGVTGDHLMQPPGFSLNGSKREAPLKRLSGSTTDKQPESDRSKAGRRSGRSQRKDFSTTLYSGPWKEGITIEIGKFNQVKRVF